MRARSADGVFGVMIDVGWNMTEHDFWLLHLCRL